MSQTKAKMHKIEVRRRPISEGEGSTVQTGANTQVFMDGKLLKGVTFFKFEVKAAGVAKVMMEMYADVDIEIETSLPRKELKSTGARLLRDGGSKALGVYEIGSYHPKDIVEKIDDPQDLANPGCASAEAAAKPYCDGCGCGKKAAFEKNGK